MNIQQLANNQVVVTDGNKETFFSYNTVIACMTGNSLVLDSYYWDYSATTLKYLKQFMHTNKTKKQIQQSIDSGEYTTADLQGVN